VLFSKVVEFRICYDARGNESPYRVSVTTPKANVCILTEFLRYFNPTHHLIVVRVQPHASQVGAKIINLWS
jgi:hypothetical protein